MTDPDPEFPATAARILRGATRLLEGLGYAAIAEYTLGNGRRADILAIDGAGQVTIVEIKSSRADFAADHKWRDYLEFCDRFYFAVEPEFPLGLLPEEVGLIFADAHGGSIRRECALQPINGNRRRSLILGVALTASRRLARVADPELPWWKPLPRDGRRTPSWGRGILVLHRRRQVGDLRAAVAVVEVVHQGGDDAAVIGLAGFLEQDIDRGSIDMAWRKARSLVMPTSALATAMMRAVSRISSPLRPLGWPLPSQRSCAWRRVSTTGPSNSMPWRMSALICTELRSSCAPPR